MKTPAAAATVSRDKYTRVLDDPDEQFAVRHDHETICNGANLRDVWTIAAEPLKEKHYAAFPTELVYRCLRAGTSARGYCSTCGKPWCRIIDSRPDHSRGEGLTPKGNHQENGNNFRTNPPSSLSETLGWRPTCSCPAAEPRPGKVLDPFMGSGRTLLAARRLGLDAVGVELNPEYAEMARRLLYEDAPLFSGPPAGPVDLTDGEQEKANQ